MIEVEQHIGAIHESIHDCSHDEGGHHIEQRVLFDEYCGHNDRSTQDKRTDSNAFIFFQALTFHNSYMAAKRIIHMDTGPQIGGSICPIQCSYQIGKYVVPRHDVGAQVMTVWPQRGYQKEDCHSGKQKSAGSEIVIFVAEEEVHDHHRYVCKPEQVGDDKYFTKRNIVVKSYMNDTIMTCNGPFQMTEPGKIDDTVNDQRNSVPVFFSCFFHDIDSPFN